MIIINKMICRLCLKDFPEYELILLFNSDENNTETKVAKMITKYFHLEITQDDTISTSICQDCFDHLEEFHKFWTYVDQQQSTLRNAEFLEVKCDVEINSDAAEHMHDDDIKQDELLFDVAKIEEANVEAAEMACEEFEFGSSNPIEKQTNYDSKTCLDGNDDDDSSDDDDTPLVKLKRKCTKKSSDKVKRKKSQKESKKKYADRSERETVKRNNELIKSFMDITCDLCNETMEKFGDLRSHFMEKHNCEPYMKCCNKKFRKSFKLVQHIKWHKNPNEFKCTVCDKQFKSNDCLASHKVVHSSRPPPTTYTCPVCKKEFRSKKTFQNHLDIHENAKIYNCEICGKSFPLEQRLRNHIRSIHENIYPYICDTCGKKFKSKPSFERHILLHQGVIEEPAQCDICNKWLKNKHSLRLHRMLHADKGIKCEVCGRFCPTKRALRRHTRYMHELENNLQCTFCDRTFKETRSLEEHIATHTGAQLYSCPHCSRESRSQSNMYAHIKRDHVEEWIKLKIARSNDPNFKVKVQ